MNILPKKRWHVRTRENIARVRRDEAKAAAEEQAILDRAKLAEREATIAFLRKRSRTDAGLPESETPETEIPKPESYESGHVNFFKDLEDGSYNDRKINAEREKEKKEEQEKYEKKIGYLTYLGQDTNEALGTKSWYDVAPKWWKDDEESGEIGLRHKIPQDPLQVMKKYLDRKPEGGESTSKQVSNSTVNSDYSRKRKHSDSVDDLKIPHKKHKKHKHKKEKQGDYPDQNKLKLEKLRQERLERERRERARTEALLAGLNGVTPKQKEQNEPPMLKQKYNSQFNPELAKQNYDFHYSTHK